MCNFCQLHIDGYESCRDYISTSISLGSIENAMEMTIWHLEDEENATHSLDVDLTTSDGSLIKSLSMPIKYCPVCGKPLERGPLYRFLSRNSEGECKMKLTNVEVDEK